MADEREIPKRHFALEPKVTVTFRLPPEKLQRLREAKLKHQTPMQDLIIEGLDLVLEKLAKQRGG